MIAIKTKKFIDAVVEAPPSKSYTQRALIISSLASGKSIIRKPLFSDDTRYMISALNQFGVKIERKKDALSIHGSNGKLNRAKGKIFVGNAGTAMRFIAAIASLADGTTIITGDKRMQQRPIQDLLDALSQLGVRSESCSGFPPVKIFGNSLIGGSAKIKGSTSSQYLSSILMCAPYAKKDVKIDILGNLASKPYVDITTDAMKSFGAGIKNFNYKRLVVKAGKKYSPRNYRVEGDASSASYFLAAAAVTKGRVRVNNINPGSKQGDIKFADILKKMGCSVAKGKSFIEVKGHSLKSIDIDMNKMPDIVPTLAVVSLFADSTTTIRNVQNLRVKETDRIRALAFELRKTGANVEEMNGGLKIRRRRLQKAIIETYNDHRMAMGFAIAGLAISGIRIKNPNCVAKSFPDFWDKFSQLYR